jgi:DNA (cytosine-5)-methyltransferase 1
MDEVWGGKCGKRVGFTLRVGGRSSSIKDRRNWDSYLVDGKVRQLGPEQGLKMMGFPQSFKLPASKTASMKLLGNSVAVDAIYNVGKEIIHYLNTKDAKSKLVINREKGIFELSA